MSLRNSAYRHMVEQMPINVLVCDAKTLVITYANRKSRETLNSISALLPKGVSGSNIVGQCIDIFHKNPHHQRHLLGNKSNLPHSALIRLGKEFLDLQIMAVPGGFGCADALMLTWTVVTTMERLKRMIDKCPINIMMCDPETFEINWMNDQPEHAAHSRAIFAGEGGSSGWQLYRYFPQAPGTSAENAFRPKKHATPRENSSWY